MLFSFYFVLTDCKRSSSFLGRALFGVEAFWRLDYDSVLEMDHRSLSTKIYKWNPRPSTFRIISPYTLGVDVVVSDMKLPFGGWNVNLVHESLLSADDDLILSLPLSNSVVENSLIWNFEKSNSYTVRSGYRVGCSIVLNQSSSSLDKSVSWWKFSWCLKMPSKVIILLWKACNHWIPSNANLTKYGLSVESSCPLCHFRIESSIHVMNGDGKVIAIGAQVILVRFSPLVAEGVSLLRGLQFGLSVGVLPSILESNVLGVVNLVNAVHPFRSDIGLVIQDVL
ncbi:hypothetical protein Ddye_005555 [Dipteronia dyeriana]|uniref:Reverse transcriptase zinc-binding domain-containing protein n=1 Tax=Dipteronia dyeriana TaxID=168575 RepID=A0AAE0CPT5_9ROSI|nr:hypothetical protein Ddye_005555 [Dipteronia dyeriana]